MRQTVNVYIVFGKHRPFIFGKSNGPKKFGIITKANKL